VNRRRFVADACGVFLRSLVFPVASTRASGAHLRRPNRRRHRINWCTASDSRLTLTVNRPVDLKLQALDAPDFHLTGVPRSDRVSQHLRDLVRTVSGRAAGVLGFAAAHGRRHVVVGVNYGEADDLVRR